MGNARVSGDVGSWIDQAIKTEGVGADWKPYLNWIVQKESSGNPSAQNPKSSAYGLYQFLDGTWKGTGISKTSDPVIQTQAAIKYIKQRYGTPAKAVDFWQKNGWY